MRYQYCTSRAHTFVNRNVRLQLNEDVHGIAHQPLRSRETAYPIIILPDTGISITVEKFSHPRVFFCAPSGLGITHNTRLFSQECQIGTAYIALEVMRARALRLISRTYIRAEWT